MYFVCHIKPVFFSKFMMWFTTLSAIFIIVVSLVAIVINFRNRRYIPRAYEQVKLYKEKDFNTQSYWRQALKHTLGIVAPVTTVTVLLAYFRTGSVDFGRILTSVLCCSIIYYSVKYIYLKHNGKK